MLFGACVQMRKCSQSKSLPESRNLDVDAQHARVVSDCKWALQKTAQNQCVPVEGSFAYSWRQC